MINVVIMGPQGSGKGTQADKLAERLGVPTVSTGRLFRAEMEKNTGMGRALGEYVKRGDRVPSDMVNQVMHERLAEEDAAIGIIIDGYPRTLEQAEQLDEIMTKLDRQVTHAVYLELTDAEAVRRLSGRRVCSNPKCELNYHVDFNPPKADPNLCDRCHSPLVQRQDDVPDVIRRRLELYHRDTEPIIDFYERRGLLHRVDGSKPIDEVAAKIAEIFA